MSRQLPEVTVCLPPRWRRRSDPDRGVLLHARAPAPPPSGVHPEVVLRVEPVAAPLVAWRAEALTELANRLYDFELDDVEDYELEGRPVAYRRFAHRIAVADLVSEQWAWQVGGTGLVLTCTVAREDYAAWCDVFESIAATLDPGLDAA